MRSEPIPKINPRISNKFPAKFFMNVCVRLTFGVKNIQIWDKAEFVYDCVHGKTSIK